MQSFLGSINVIRPHCAPVFSLKLEPLKPLIQEDAMFPQNEEQLKAILITGLEGSRMRDTCAGGAR